MVLVKSTHNFSLYCTSDLPSFNHIITALQKYLIISMMKIAMKIDNLFYDLK